MKHIIEYLCIGLFILIVRLLPFRLGIRMGSLVGVLYYWIDAKHRRLAFDQLERAFSREKNNQQLKQIVRGLYRNIGLSLVELVCLPRMSRSDIESWVQIDGFHHYIEAKNKGKGVIILTAHLGNWEIIPKAFWSYGYCINAVVRPLDNPYLDRIVQGWRRKNGMVVLNKRTDVHRIMKLLREGETVGFLMDQNTVEQDAVFVDFFGQKAATHKGLAVLALRSGATVLPVFMIRTPSGHRMTIEKPLEIVRTPSHRDAIVSNTALFTSTIESVVTRYPEQWLWIHRRWKTQKTEGTL